MVDGVGREGMTVSSLLISRKFEASNDRIHKETNV